MSTQEYRMIWEEAEATLGEGAQNSSTVDSTLNTTVAQAMLVRNLRTRQIDGRYTRRDRQIGMEGGQQEELYNLHASVEYEIDVATSGVAGSIPPYNAALLGCGLVRTVVPDTSVSFSPRPATGSFSSTEIKYWHDRGRQRIWGARGSLGLTMEANQKPFFSMRKKGHYTRPGSGGTHLPDFSNWNEALECNPFNMPANAIQLGAVTTGLCMRSFSLSDGRTPMINKYMNCFDTDIRQRRYTGRLVLEYPTFGTKQIIAEMAETEPVQSLQITLGTSAGSRFKVIAPAVHLKYAGEENVDGDLAIALDLVFTPDQGDDEVTFLYD